MLNRVVPLSPQLTTLSNELLARIFEFVHPGKDLLITIPSVCRRFRQICKLTLAAEIDLRWLTVWPNREQAFENIQYSAAATPWLGEGPPNLHWHFEIFYGSCITGKLKLDREKLQRLFDRFAQIKAITLGTDGKHHLHPR